METSEVFSDTLLASESLVMVTADMKFTWDEAKRRSNLVKHGLDFADAS